jgi:hypothetical protein
MQLGPLDLLKQHGRDDRVPVLDLEGKARHHVGLGG